MLDSKMNSYSSILARVTELVKELDRCDDIDKVMTMYEEAITCLNECESRIEQAKGKFDEMTSVKKT